MKVVIKSISNIDLIPENDAEKIILENLSYSETKMLQIDRFEMHHEPNKFPEFQLSLVSNEKIKELWSEFIYEEMGIRV